MTDHEHMLPANIDAERDVLGSILRNRDALTAVVSWLQPSMFYLEKHRWVYEAVLACFSRREPPDIRMVSEELRRRDQLEIIGGMSYLYGIDDTLVTSYHVGYYARIVERLAGNRELIAAGGQIAALGYDEQDELESVRAKAQTILTQATQGGRSEDLVHIRDVMMRVWESIHSAHAPGIKTGFRDLDEMTGGLQRGDLIILAARPSVGKTSCALSLLYNIAARYNQPGLLFSLEMNQDQLAIRLASIHSGINSGDIRDRLVQEGEPMARLADAFGVVSELPIILCDNASMSIAGVRARVMRHLQQYPNSVVIVDYLQLMLGGKSENRVQEVSQISRGLKQIARDANVPLIALSQLSRAVEGRTSHVPMLSDLRECVTGSTRLINADTGHWVPIREVKPGDKVLGLNTDDLTAPFVVGDVWSTGIKPVFTVTTRTGRRITATINHPLLTATGWCAVGYLQPGDLIATTMKLQSHGTADLSPDLCRLLGYLTGDGTYQHHRAVGFISSDPATFADVVSIVSHHFPDVSVRMKHDDQRYQEANFVCLQENGYGKPHGNPLREWLREIGVEGQRDSTKHVPPFVFENVLNAAQFVAGYLSSDGCVKVRFKGSKSPKWAIHFDTVSRALAEDIQALLLILGVIACVDGGHMSVKRTKPIYRINVATSAHNLRRFAQIVPAIGRKGELLKVMLESLTKRQTGNHLFTLPKEVSSLLASKARRRDQGKRMRRDVCAEWAERLDDNELRRWANSDLLWEPIASIEPAGEEEVFDISVPGCGNFVGNGIIAHNSGALEQDADIVIFIYRDELYDKETDRKGIAELHVAKHRNGPIGVVPLRFDAATTRFSDLSHRTPEGY